MFLVYIGGICIFLFALVSLIFSSCPPFFTLFISFYYISDDVSLFQWHAVIGIFDCRNSGMSYRVCNLSKNFVWCFEILLFLALLRMCFYYFVNTELYLQFFTVPRSFWTKSRSKETENFFFNLPLESQ